MEEYMKQLVLALLFMLLLSFCAFAEGLTDADYTTPDSWSQHVTANGFKSESALHNFAGGYLSMSLTTKFTYQDNDYAIDQNLYQYLRMNYSQAKLGSGTVSGGIFTRVGKDIDGQRGDHWGDSYYYFYNDTLDVEEKESSASDRLYHAFLKFDNVVKGTVFTLGRQYADHIDTYQFDGADVNVNMLDDKLTLSAFGGVPVSYYYDTNEDMVYGAGAELKPFEAVTIRGVYTYLDVTEEKTDLVKIRGDLHKDNISGYAEYGSADSNGYYKVGGTYRIPSTKTSFVIGYEELLDEIGAEDGGGYITNPLAYSLMPYGKYKKIKMRLSQGITENLVSGIGAEIKDADTENMTNRSFNRYSAYIDLVRFPTENTYISFNADYWDVDANSASESNKSTTFGFQATQVMTDDFEVWIGSSFERFEYDAEDNEVKDWVKMYYAGGQYSLTGKLSITASVYMEDSEVLERDSADLERNYQTEVWLNISI